MKYISFAIAAFLAFSQPAYADQINADRPGPGSGPETAEPGSVQIEAGNDSKNIRIGVAKDFEINKDLDSVGAKYKFFTDKKFEAAIKISYQNDSTFIIEIPTQYIISKKINLSTDVILDKDSKTYVGSVNVTPVSNLTVSNSFYYDDKARYGIFLAWAPTDHPNLQFDVGLDRGRIKFGVSWGIKFHR